MSEQPTEPTLCPCGHVAAMCHRENAARWCPPVREQPAGLREALERAQDMLREGQTITAAGIINEALAGSPSESPGGERP